MSLSIGFLPFMAASTAVALVSSRLWSELTTPEALGFILPTAVALYTIYCSWIFPFYISELRHIPTVPGFPLWGQFLTIITTECGVVQRDWHQKYGPIVRYFFPFGSERLSVTDDDAIKQMTVRNPYNYPKPQRARIWMRQILGEGVLLAEGNAHVVQRKALTPAFSITSIRSLMPIFWAKSLHMASLWDFEMARENSNTKCFEVLDWLNRTTLDIIGRAGLGTDINSLTNPEAPLRDAYRRCFDFDIQARIINGLAAFTPLIRLLPARANRDMAKARSIILDHATRIIEDKESKNDENSTAPNKDIIGLIVKNNLVASKEDSLTVETMRDQVMTFLGAGHDTTATSAAWTLLMLAKNQDVQDKLREEIRSHMPFLFDAGTREDGDRVEKADVDLLPYLEDVCKESLRYIPSIPMTVRKTVQDDMLGGYFIPGGTTIYLMANCINRLPTYWGDTAHTFDPSRWKSLPDTYTTNAFMTFLQGPRGCVGRKFAEVEMKTILCSLLSKFSFEVDPSVQDPEELKMWRLVLRPRDGMNLKVSLLK